MVTVSLFVAATIFIILGLLFQQLAKRWTEFFDSTTEYFIAAVLSILCIVAGIVSLVLGWGTIAGWV